jgi:septin family protein
VDTPGFGDQIDNEASFGEIVGYLERQYDDILAEESRIKRNPRFRDNRVHALLYFITPTGHGLRELDIELMKRLSPRVNVIPVIGKADSLTPAELAESKKLVMEDIEHYRIPVYNFPYDIEEDDEDTVEENAELRGLMPFAIVGSEDVLEIGGRRVRARQYPWGVVEVDNPRHSDFLAIRSALLHSHLADLKEITHDFLYENYRTEKLSKSVDGGAKYDIPSITYGIRLTFFTVPRTRPSTLKISPHNLFASRRSSSGVRRRSYARSKSKYNVRSTKSGRSSWLAKVSCARSRLECNGSRAMGMILMVMGHRVVFWIIRESEISFSSKRVDMAGPQWCWLVVGRVVAHLHNSARFPSRKGGPKDYDIWS